MFIVSRQTELDVDQDKRDNFSINVIDLPQTNFTLFVSPPGKLLI